MFIGQAKHQLDEKGRIRIPPRFKKDLGDNPFFTCGSNGCLFVYSAEEAERVFLSKFRENDFADADSAKSMRLLMANAWTAEIDKQGRIPLPKHLIEHAHLEKDIVTIGAFNRVEIWSEGNWLAYSKGIDFDEALKAIKNNRCEK